MLLLEVILAALALFVVYSWWESWVRDRQDMLLADQDKAQAREELRRQLGREPTEDEVYSELRRDYPD